MPPVSPTRSSNNHSPPPRRTNRSSVQGRGRKMHANFLAAAGGEDVQRHRLERMRQRALARARNMERVADRERRGWTTEGMVTNMRVFNLNPEDNYEEWGHPPSRTLTHQLPRRSRLPPAPWQQDARPHLDVRGKRAPRRRGSPRRHLGHDCRPRRREGCPLPHEDARARQGVGRSASTWY